ncbi:MAG TPA: hypothetical protein VKU44_01160 [Terriglobia bacterium]|nr:hypothetical protein [Terriglobia bacterium]
MQTDRQMGPEVNRKSLPDKPSRRPPTPCRSRLNTLTRVRQELVRVYKAARAGDIPVSDASKLAHVLYTVGRLLVAQDLEVRVGRLERAADDQGQGGW